MRPYRVSYFTKLALIVSVFLLSSCAIFQKPKHISDSERRYMVQQDIKNMFANQEPVNQSIDLYQAMARAVKYNLDIKLKAMEAQTSRSDLTLSKFNMLPRVTFDAGYDDRNNINASASRQLDGQLLAANTPSTSEDQHLKDAGLGLSWNVLDFATSYIETEQKGNITLVADERQRKVVHNIIRDVRYSYWRAESADRMIRELKPLKRQVDKALQRSNIIQKQNLRTKLTNLEYQKSLWEVRKEISVLQKNQMEAKQELAGLMDLNPGVPYRVKRVRQFKQPIPDILPHDMRSLEWIGLNNRPEIREELYRDKISIGDIRKARLSMFPGISYDFDRFYNSNSFLVNNYWTINGVNLAWNLIKLVSGPSNIKFAKNNEKVATYRRMALGLTIMTQVDIAYLRYLQTQKIFRETQQIASVNRKIYKQLSLEYRVGKIDELSVIRANANRVVSLLQRDIAYAEWQNAAGELVASVGIDPLPHLSSNDSVHSIENKLRMYFTIEPAIIVKSHQQLVKLINIKALLTPGQQAATKAPLQELDSFIA